MNRKGVSQAVAWVLLVGLSISLTIFVGVWLQDQSKDAIEGIVSDSEIKGRCSNVYFSAEDNCKWNDPDQIDNITFKNTGSFTISKFKCNGDDNVIGGEGGLAPGEKYVWQGLSTCNSNIQSIILVPFVKIENEEHGCAERTLTINC